MSGDEDRAKAAGCDDFLTKPIDEDLLFAKLSSVARMRSLIASFAGSNHVSVARDP